MGNAQVLGNGNVVVGWGSEPYVTEFAPDGSIVLRREAATRRPELPGVPLPLGRATGDASEARRALERAAGRKVYVSWNGATEVAAWQLLAGPTAAALTVADKAPRQGFETAFAAPKGMRFAAAVALDRHGNQLGRSETIRI